MEAWRDGQLVFDPRSGRYVQMDFWKHVADDYSKGWAFGTPKPCLAFCGVFAVTPARAFVAIGSRLPRVAQLLAKPSARLSESVKTLLARPEASKPAQAAFLRRFFDEFREAASSEVAESTAEKLLQRMLASKGDLVGIAGAGLIAVGKGILVGRRGLANRIALQGALDQQILDAMGAELKAAGYEVLALDGTLDAASRRARAEEIEKTARTGWLSRARGRDQPSHLRQSARRQRIRAGA